MSFPPTEDLAKSFSSEPVDNKERCRRVRRILEDAADLKRRHENQSEKGQHFCLTNREVANLRAAFEKTMAKVNQSDYDKLAIQCDNVLWELEKTVGEDQSAKTGDQDRVLKGIDENWKFRDIPLARRRQTLGVTFLNFFVAVPLCVFFGIVFLFNSYTRWPMAIYLGWIIYRSFIRGPTHPLRRYKWWVNLTVWAWIRDYFPVRLVVPKVVRKAITPAKNYMFCYHPHGVHSFGCMVGLGTDVAGISEFLPGITIHCQTLSMNFWTPFWREILMPAGVGDASKECIRRTLRAGPGESVALVVGGAEESLMSSPKTNDLTLSKRRGFIKLALEAGAPLVPVFGFGETNCYGNYAEGRPWLQAYLKKFQKTFGFAIPMIKGRGWFNYNFGPLPHRRQIHVVVGEPLDLPRIPKPSPNDVNEWHGKYVKHLMQLYKDHRYIYDMQRRRDAHIVT